MNGLLGNPVADAPLGGTRRVVAAILCTASMALLGCGVEDEPQPATPASEASPAGPVAGPIEVVDLQDNPLPGMIPIATATPNAFDAPVATGDPTDASGRGNLLLPRDKRMYVRAWDPKFEWFANNFFDVPPGSGTETPLMRIVMVRGASLEAVLLNPDGAPAANTNVGLMMFHPTKGAWWPDEADTDGSGAVHFPALPAGTFTIKLKILEGRSIDLPGVELPPGGHTDVGVLTLQ